MLAVSRYLDSNDLDANLPQRPCNRCADYSGPEPYRKTCTPKSLPLNGKAVPKCSNCRFRRAKCGWGIKIPRQMNTIKISIYQELPDSTENDLIDDNDGNDDDDGNDDNDYDYDSEYNDDNEEDNGGGEDNDNNSEDADKGGSEGLDESGDHHHHYHHHNNNANTENGESVAETLEAPDMTSREYLLQATNTAMARMCLEQERDFDRLIDELEKFYASDS